MASQPRQAVLLSVHGTHSATRFVMVVGALPVGPPELGCLLLAPQAPYRMALLRRVRGRVRALRAQWHAWHGRIRKRARRVMPCLPAPEDGGAPPCAGAG